MRRDESALVLFSFYYFELYYQYLYLYSFRDITSFGFWMAYVVVLISNIVDTTGLLFDLQTKLKISFFKTLIRPREQEIVQSPSASSLATIDISKLSEKFGQSPTTSKLRLVGSNAALSSPSRTQASDGQPSRSQSGPPDGFFTADDGGAYETVSFTISSLQTQCYVMVTVPIIMAFMQMLDIYAQSPSFALECTVSCNYHNPAYSIYYVIVILLLLR